MQDKHGFELVGEQEIAEVGCSARLWRHSKTGAELVSARTKDENKVFGISFRTPVSDSTGVPHILEHSVLCGSDKFPTKEPFVELLKGSLQTFLNAFTYPDKTCYPVASTNLQDFYNLVDVYLDAVFHPRITEDIFRQEGWHYELDDPDGPLTRKGVVYNEMKGAYSSPDSLLYEYSQQALFPDVTYGLESGGDPEVIPELTYEQFKAFHETYYHPSNARIWFWGDDPEDERLRLLDAVLCEYSELKVESEVGVQAPFDEPRVVYKSFDGSEDAKGMVTVSWLLPEVGDPELGLSLEVLEELLVGLPSSPLRRALMESGLGEDLAGAGLENELRQMFFSTGLKGIDPDKAMQVQDLIVEVLERVAQDGPSQEMVEAALNTVEFDLRENNSGRFPKGLSLMLHSLTAWLHGGDPFGPLAFEAPLAALKKRLDAGEPVFQDLISTHLLGNSHRSTVVLSADPQLGPAKEKREREALAAELQAMDAATRARIMAEAGELARLQEEPDSPEALATIPRLGLEDLEPEEKSIPTTLSRLGGVDVLAHDLPTQGIVYLDAGLDLSPVPDSLLPLVPVFGRVLLEMGTARADFAELTLRIARKTGGMGTETFASPRLDFGPPAARLFVRGKATSANAREMLDILREVLLEVRLDDKERFRQILLEEKARMEQSLIPSGHMVVVSRLRARTGPAGWVAERMGGISALEDLRRLAKDVDSDWGGVLERLQRLRTLLVDRKTLILNVTAGRDDLLALEAPIEALASALPEVGQGAADWTPGELPHIEGLSLPAQVNYVGKVLDLSKAGYRFSGAHLALAKYARMAWLWERVRVRGGAYGAFCILDRFASSLSFASYRDPNLDSTLQAFDGTAAFFSELRLDREEMIKAIVGAMGDVDPYLLPDAQGFTAMLRQLTSDTPEDRQTMRDQLLAATVEDFNAFGDLLGDLLASGDVVVLGAAEAMEQSDLAFETRAVL